MIRSHLENHWTPQAAFRHKAAQGPAPD